MGDRCKCGSHAINPDLHGRDKSNTDLCDVCYWRVKADSLQSRLLEYKSMHTEMQEDIQTFLSEINDLHQQLSEIRGVAGYPAKDELKKRGLTDSLADIIRCNHQRYMEATHRAEQREIAAQIQVDSMQSQLSEATTRIERMENLFFLAMDFIDKHPADPDISKDQTEAWLKILNSNAMDEFARLRQQGKG